jgi:hypothetical protein
VAQPTAEGEQDADEPSDTHTTPDNPANGSGEGDNGME